MKWTDELSVKEHFSFLTHLERSTTDFEDVLTAYEADRLFETVRDTPDDDLLDLSKRAGVWGAIAKVCELRIRGVIANQEKPEHRKFTIEQYRIQLHFLLGSLLRVGGDYISYMAYCEYVALRKENQTDACNFSWNEWQDAVTVKRVLDSFYSRVEEERQQHWQSALKVELARKELPPEKAPEEPPAPLDSSSEPSE